MPVAKSEQPVTDANRCGNRMVAMLWRQGGPNASARITFSPTIYRTTATHCYTESMKCAIWCDENVEHIEEHGLTVDDVEYVLANPTSFGKSKSSGFPCVWGYIPSGDFIIVVYEDVDEMQIYPVTAYRVDGG